MIVRELVTLLGFKVNDAQLRQADQGVKKLQTGASELVGTLKAAAAAFIGFQSVKSIITIGDEMQSMRSRIALLPQTIGDAGAALDKIGQRATASGMSIDAYGKLYTRVGNAAKDYIKTQEDLLGITDTISKALVVGGASTQEASAVMLQFSQALASGVLQGDEFRSMAEAAPQYLDALSEAMNIPRENLKKMASDGKLTAKSVIEATRSMSTLFEDKFKAMPMTVGRAMTMVGNRFSLAIDKINRKSLFITNIANGIVDAFDSVETGIKSVIRALGGFDATLRLITISVGVATVALVAMFGAKMLAALRAFRAVFLTTFLPLLKIALIIAAVTLVVEDLYIAIQGGNSVIGSFLKWLNSGTVAATSLMVILLALGTVASVAAFIFGSILAVKVAMATAAMVQVGLVSLIAGAKIAAGWLLALWPIALVIAAIAAVAVGAYMLITHWQKVKDWFAALFDWFAGKFAIFGEWVGGLVDKAKSLIGIAGGGATGTWAEAAGSGLGVTPASVAQSGGVGKPSVQSTTNVNLTVPPGTTAEQSAFLKKSAGAYFGNADHANLARELSVMGT